MNNGQPNSLKSNLLRIGCLCFLLALMGCDEKTYSEFDLLKMTQKIEPSFDFITDVVKPDTMDGGVKCEDYGGAAVGCMYGKRVRIRKVIFIILNMESHVHAKELATKLDLYYTRNWVFDDVRGEPVLENFVEVAYGATRPKKVKK